MQPWFISGFEILLILAALALLVILALGGVFLVVWLVRRSRRDPVPSAGPAAAAGSTGPGPSESSRVAGACPKCGTQLAPGAAQGLCPRCLMSVGIGTQPAARPGGEAASVAPIDPAELAQSFPQLEILELIGQGGMGLVYKARQKQLDRVVALKVLTRGAAKDPAFAERFNREARALARLNHPNIITVYDFGEVNGLFHLVMEYIDGADLRHVLQQGRLTPAEALRIVPPICDALQYAHANGVVHRDIKPGNILLDREGRVKIADFGIAKLAGSSTPDFTLTQARQSMGTPHYMAPEQVENPQTVDHRADIYSVGVVFYEMLTGELPLGRFAPPSRRVEVDVRLDEVVLRALEKEPSRRYQQAGDVKTEVERIRGDAPSARPPISAPPAASAFRLSWRIIVAALWTAMFPLWLIIMANLRGGPPLILVAPIALLGFAPFGVTLLGLWEWRTLRRRVVPPTVWEHRLAVIATVVFPLATLAFLSFALPMILLVEFLRGPSNAFAAVVSLLVAGSVAALCATIVWRRLLRRTESTANHGLGVRRVLPGVVLVAELILSGFLFALFMRHSRMHNPTNFRIAGGMPELVSPAEAFFEWNLTWRFTPEGPDFSQWLQLGPLTTLDASRRTEVDEALKSAWAGYREALKTNVSRSTNAAGHTVIQVTPFPGRLDEIESGFWTRIDEAVSREVQSTLRMLMGNRLRGAWVQEGGGRRFATEKALFRFGDQPFTVEFWRMGSWYHSRETGEAGRDEWFQRTQGGQSPELPEQYRVLVEAAP